MKKIALSTLAALCVVSAASAQQLYTDTTTGQVFTTPGQGRVAIGSGSSSSSVMNKLKFSGEAYMAYNNMQYRNAGAAGGNVSEFELNRMYLQAKAFVFPNPKDYFRVTLDVTSHTGDKTLRIKYAYLYLDNILPFASAEIGQVHRPWHDYEEHRSWFYRTIAPTFVENKNGANLASSADLGITFHTKTKYITALYGVYNGEGYHAGQPSGAKNGMSGEWRLTAHLMGSDKSIKNTYLNVSYYGIYDVGHYQPEGSGAYKNEVFHAFHAVFNMPNFLIAGEYITAPKDFGGLTRVTDSHSFAGSGYSVNVEGRMGSDEQYRAFARYDNWSPKVKGVSSSELHRRTYFLGAAWVQNKHLMWVLSDITQDDQRGSYMATSNGNSYMLSARVKF
jgi:hypothetical protein